MRLTRQIEGRYIIIHNWSERATFEDQNKEELGAQKLGLFEDIEDEFCVDLVKLLQSRKIYYMGWHRNELVIKETYNLYINLAKRIIEFTEDEYTDYIYSLDLKDYGRNDIYGGWALTKEELV